MISLGAGIVVARRRALSPWLAVGLGAGAAALSLYTWLVLGGAGLGSLLGIEALVLGAALLTPRAPRSTADASARRGDPVPWALVGMAGLVFAVGFGNGVLEFPDGAWDAVDIWNARARALVRADLATALRDAKHPDYPLLLPLLVAHAWTWLGEGRALPVAVAALFSVASAGLLVALAAARSGRRWAAVLGVLLVASPSFAIFGASQRADVPLGYFVLAASGLLALSLERRDPRLLPVAGALLGCAAFTKNEGLLFAGVAGLAWASLASPSERRRAWRLAAGAALPLAALLHHKLTCGSTTDLIAMQDASLFERVVDPARMAQILGAFAVGGAPYATVWGATALAGRARRAEADRAGRFVQRTLLGMLAGYFAVYLATPRDLTWHLDSSLDRLLQQLWPLALLALAFMLPRPAPTAGRAGLPSDAMAPSQPPTGPGT